MPLAGRLTDIGQKILSLGGKRAMYITTLDLGAGSQSTQVSPRGFNESYENKGKNQILKRIDKDRIDKNLS